MTVFSIIKKSRQQAKEHDAKQLDKLTGENAKTPYKHVPTHAAVDALTGAPSSWQHDYKRRIQEQNRQRKSPSALQVRSHTTPRVSSSLSNVSYPAAHASPFTSSSTIQNSDNLPTTWQHMSPRDKLRPETRSKSWKGKEREAIPPVPPIPPLSALRDSRARIGGKSSKLAHASMGTGDSSSSEDDLEIYHSRSISYYASTRNRASPNELLRHHSANATGLQQAQLLRQRKIYGQLYGSHQSAPRAHKFTAPKPISHEALVIPAFPLPPESSRNCSTATPSTTAGSYASSVRSDGSTASSFLASTPSTSTVASFPSGEKLPVLAKSTTGNESASRGTTNPGGLSKAQIKGASHTKNCVSVHRLNNADKNVNHAKVVHAADQPKRSASSADSRPAAEITKSRWSFLWFR